MTLPGTIRAAGLSRWICSFKKVIQHVNGIVQKVTVSIPNRDVDFGANLGTKRFPVLFKDKTQIVFLPMLDDGFVDLP